MQQQATDLNEGLAWASTVMIGISISINISISISISISVSISISISISVSVSISVSISINNINITHLLQPIQPQLLLLLCHSDNINHVIILARV
jgi:hypothetical protein